MSSETIRKPKPLRLFGRYSQKVAWVEPCSDGERIVTEGLTGGYRGDTRHLRRLAGWMVRATEYLDARRRK